MDKRIVVSSIEEKKSIMVFETPYTLNHVTTNPEGNVLACSTEAGIFFWYFLIINSIWIYIFKIIFINNCIYIIGEILFYDLRFKRLVGTIPAYENQPIKGLLFQVSINYF